VRPLATQFDDPGAPGGVATPTCGGCCCCCCCVGTLLTASTVSAMRLHDVAADRGRRGPARVALAVTAAVLFPLLVPLGILIHNADVSEQLLLVLPALALVVLLTLWPLAGARGAAAVVPPVVIVLVAAAVFVLEVVVGGYLLVGGLWPAYVLLLIAMPAGAAFAQHARRARR
jgi:hypothetical protein